MPASPTSGGQSLTAVNSVFRGSGKDVVVSTDESDPFCAAVGGQCFQYYRGRLTLSHSNYRTSDDPIEAEDASQSGDPLFTDPAGGDYRVQAGSPLIDAGVDDPANGPVDLAGALRNQGAAPDIGAYQFPSGSGGGGDGGEAPTPLPINPPVADKVAPKLSRLALTNARFAVAKGSTPAAAARARRVRRGTTFVYSTSEAAHLTIAVQRRASGRRAKGGKCVKATRGNRRAKTCVRWLGRGKLTRVGAKGLNALPFSGRIGRKALAPGRYRALFGAADLSGNRSGAKALGFKIVKG